MSNEDYSAMQYLTNLVRAGVRDRASRLRTESDVEGGLRQIADSCVPDSYGELAEAIADDPSLGFDPEGGEVAGPSIWSLIHYTIHARLYEVAVETWNELGDENA